MGYFDMLFGYEWELTKSPAGAHQWTPKNCRPEHLIPDAHDPSRKSPPMMTTADLSLRFDPAYEKISRRFHQNPQAFADAFARAWFKLTHRDMGPRARYLGKLVPPEVLIWQDPVPAVDHPLVDARQDIAALKARCWPRACPSRSWSTPRGRRLDVPRQRQARRRQRRAHPPGAAEGLGGQPARRTVAGLTALEAIQKEFNGVQSGGKKVSLADLIVLGGCAAVEAAAKRAGVDVKVPFTPGRTDASQEQTDVDSFAVLEPKGRRLPQLRSPGAEGSAAELLVDKAQLLTLTAPEMTVLVGGLRALNANVGGRRHMASSPSGRAR
jgi:catalase-peroxidase